MGQITGANMAEAIPFSVFGGIILVLYGLFVFVVIKQGDFYAARRWKAAAWAAVLSVVFFEGVLAVITFTLLLSGSHDLSFRAALGIASQSLISVLLLLPCLGPLLFVITIGTYYRLKHWLDSDRFLDRIWDDPNKGRRTPIQWL